MPTYVYKCPVCLQVFEKFLRMRDSQTPQHCTSCDNIAEKQLVPVAVRGDYAGYSCPITGEWIEGRRAHERNLQKHNCRLLEPGETAQAAAAGKSDEALYSRIAETAAEVAASFPHEKQKQLAKELSSGDISITRT